MINKKPTKEMFLVVGLGNPGKEYENTKHNTGYIIVDNIANKCETKITKNKFNGLHAKVSIHYKDVILLKPTTYMNLSGDCVIQYANYFGIPADHIIIIYDDVDIQMGKIRIKPTGSAGTHNGMRSIVSSLSTEEFPRIRIGIKRLHDEPLTDYVLSPYTKEQLEHLKEISEDVYGAVFDIIDNDISHAMNKHNGKGENI